MGIYNKYYPSGMTDSAATPYNAAFGNHIENALYGLKLGVINMWSDYGVVGDNSTNVTTPIQAAIDDAIAATVAGAGDGYILYFPRGSYVITGNLNIPPGALIVVMGEAGGYSGNAAYVTRFIGPTGTGALLTVAGTGQGPSTVARAFISNIAFDANDRKLLVMDKVGNSILENVSFNWTSATALEMKTVYNSRINGMDVNSCGTGTTSPAVLLGSNTGIGTQGGTSQVKITDVHWIYCTGTEFKLMGAPGDNSPIDGTIILNFNIERAAQTTNMPAIDIDYAQATQISNGFIGPFGTSDPSPAIRQAGTATGRPTILNSVNISHAGTPTYVIDHQVGGMVLSGVACITGTTPTAQYRIGSAVGSSGAVVSSFYSNLPTKRFLDQRAEGYMGKGFKTVARQAGSATHIEWDDWPVWNFAADTNNDYQASIQVPGDALTGVNCKFRLWWVLNQATGVTQNVFWRVLSNDIPSSPTAGFGIGVSTAYNGLTSVDGGWSGGAVFVTDITGPNVTPGRLMKVTVERLGADATDTLASDVRLFNVEVIYEKQL